MSPRWTRPRSDGACARARLRFGWCCGVTPPSVVASSVSSAETSSCAKSRFSVVRNQIKWLWKESLFSSGTQHLSVVLVEQLFSSFQTLLRVPLKVDRAMRRATVRRLFCSTTMMPAQVRFLSSVLFRERSKIPRRKKSLKRFSHRDDAWSLF